VNRRFRPSGRSLLVVAGASTAAALALASCGGGSGDSGGQASGPPRLKVSGAYMPAPMSGDMATGFFTVTNSGGDDDTLTSISSDAAADVTLHQTKGGTMLEKDSFPVPAHGRLAFTSGGNHLMFEKLGHRPKEGEKVAVELHFAVSGTVEVEIPVKSATYVPKTGH
jgi:copper(I)-binding protein